MSKQLGNLINILSSYDQLMSISSYLELVFVKIQCRAAMVDFWHTIVAMIVDNNFIERLGFHFKMSFWCRSLDPGLADLAGKNLGFLWHFTSDCGWDHF